MNLFLVSLYQPLYQHHNMDFKSMLNLHYIVIMILILISTQIEMKIIQIQHDVKFTPIFFRV